MNDIYTTAINTQKATTQWMDILADNLTNCYSPGFRESKVNFKTFLGGAVIDHSIKNFGQGKSTPGTSNENVFFEGAGFVVIYTGDILTMPGFPKAPAALNIDCDNDGNISGLF